MPKKSTPAPAKKVRVPSVRRPRKQPPNTTLVNIPFLLSPEAFQHFDKLLNSGVSVASMVCRGIEHYLQLEGERAGYCTNGRCKLGAEHQGSCVLKP